MPSGEPGRVSSHGEWDKAQQRYEDGCKSGVPEHDVRRTHSRSTEQG